MQKVGELKAIKIADIQENPDALRQVNRATESYAGLVDSIKEMGVLKPINVREVPSREDPNIMVFGLIDGAHRFNAAQDAGLTEIPAYVLNFTNAQALEAQIMANVHKIETKPAEYSDALLRILAGNPTMTRNDLAKTLAKSPKWLDDRLSITKLHGDIQKLVDDNKLNLTNAYALAKLKEHDEQLNFLDRAMTEAPAVFAPLITERVKQINEAKRKGQAATAETFVPVAHLRKVKEQEEEIKDGKAASIAKSKGIITTESDFIAGVKWALHLDPDSLVEAEEKWKAKKSEREDAKKKASVEKAKKQAAEANKILAEAGVNVGAVAEPEEATVGA